MFLTVSVYLQQQSFYKLIVVSANTKYDTQLIKRRFLKMDLYSPKHVQRILKIKANHKTFVYLVYTHIAR